MRTRERILCLDGQVFYKVLKFCSTQISLCFSFSEVNPQPSSLTCLPVANDRLIQVSFSRPYRKTARKYLESMSRKAGYRLEGERQISE